jgi:hypothetical protein
MRVKADNRSYLFANLGDCKNAEEQRSLNVTKPNAGQAFQAGSFVLCAFLVLRVMSGSDGTEFSGGWLTGPLLSIANSGNVLFILAAVLTFPFPRVAAGIGLVASLLCVPLCAFFIVPVPFAQVFARGHEFSVRPTPGFHWQTWPIATLLAVVLADYLCVRHLAANAHAPTLGEQE